MKKLRISKISRPARFIVITGLLIFFLASVKTFQLYRIVYSPNIHITADTNTYLYIPTGSDLAAVRNLLSEKHYLKNIESFDWVAEKKNYRNHIRPGKYGLANKMNNNELVNLLRSGKQEPVNVIFNSVRSLEKLCGIVSGQIEADSMEILDLLHDEEYISGFGFSRNTLPGLFVPNTYEFYWNSSARDFVERMAREYKLFWNEERKRKAEEKGLTLDEVTILASIIDEETNKQEEKPLIAGVYLNRLSRGIPLQACPTLRYATGDYTIRRVLLEHMEVDSPYNTYKYRGFPPGPISVPSIQAIDAVLNSEKHQYLYFCAKEDLSGYHYFSKTLEEHNRYAQLYQQVLNRQRVLR